GSWLYGVAYRLALKTRSGAASRQARERRFAEMGVHTPSTEATWQELRSVLDEELHALPEKYRAPLVLWYLEGKTNVEAARILGWAPGSMSKCMTRARDLLRSRLIKRGVSLSATTLAVLLTENARAALPANLVNSTASAAILAAGGKAVTGI